MVIDTIPPELIDAGLEPLIELLRPFFVKMSFVVGGIFGLYFILIVVRVYYERKTIRLLQCIRYDLDRMNMHHGIGYSTQRRGVIYRMFRHLKHKFQAARMERGFRKIDKARNKKQKRKKKR